MQPEIIEIKLNDYTVLRHLKNPNMPKGSNTANQAYSYNDLKSEANMHHEESKSSPELTPEQEAQYKAGYWRNRYLAFMKEMEEDMVSPTSVTAPNVSGYGWGGNFGANLVGVNPGDAVLIGSLNFGNLHLGMQGLLAYQGSNALYMSQCFAEMSKQNALETVKTQLAISELKSEVFKDKHNDAKDAQIIALLQMIAAKLPTPSNGD
jgi:hypothetical protein